MTSKVLGFRKKDAEIIIQTMSDNHEWEDKLVPVVSVEWLEKYFRETSVRIWKHGNKHFILIEDLRSAMKKETRK